MSMNKSSHFLGSLKKIWQIQAAVAPIMEQKRMATILGDVKMEGSKVDRHFVVALHMGAECRNRKNVKTLADQHAAKHLLVKRCEKDEQNNVITRHQPVLEIPTMPTEVLEMHRGLDHGTSHAPEHTWHHRSQGHQPRYSIDRKGWSIFAANAKLCFSQKKWSLIWFSCLKEPTLPNFEERQCTNVLYLRILTDTHSNI